MDGNVSNNKVTRNCPFKTQPASKHLSYLILSELNICPKYMKFWKDVHFLTLIATTRVVVPAFITVSTIALQEKLAHRHCMTRSL